MLLPKGPLRVEPCRIKTCARSSAFQVDNFLLAPGAGGRIGEFKCLYPIINRRENSFAVRKNIKKVLHFGGVGSTIALQKEWFKKSVLTALSVYATTSVGRTLPTCNIPLLPSTSKR
jgi:hypothetical protein